jgi:hypothetical protein
MRQLVRLRVLVRRQRALPSQSQLRRLFRRQIQVQAFGKDSSTGAWKAETVVLADRLVQELPIRTSIAKIIRPTPPKSFVKRRERARRLKRKNRLIGLTAKRSCSW